ncbi:thioredoxin family protein [Planococcus antarcticus DSM 14505]|uniref:Thioredoxin family protein n=1 Tax=Planococcus antarcticus DSM 14505 TaxID=1185653 RepID=A0AA87IKP6_9BACL|nr:thioredoxin family protein [Planococcus antarcticus]EIM06605.1 thioredoxin family protein [Planococcus antarcticus DSM 14505]
MKNLRSTEEFQELVKEPLAIFMFTAAWCPDCRVIDPIMPEIEKTFPDLAFVSVDRDQFIDLCIEQDVYGIPSFLAYANGQETGRFVSKDRKTQTEIEEFISNLPK